MEKNACIGYVIGEYIWQKEFFLSSGLLNLKAQSI